MAQTPLPATTRNFYQLVFDRMVSCVVQLTGLKEGGKEACAPYWPSALTETEKRFGEFSVELEHEDKQDGYVIRTFSLVKDQVSLSLPYCLLVLANFGQSGCSYKFY